MSETAGSFGLYATKSACEAGKLKSKSSFAGVVFVQPESTAASVFFKSEDPSACQGAAAPSELTTRGISTTDSRRVVKDEGTLPADLLHVPACGDNVKCTQALFPNYKGAAAQVLAGKALLPSCGAPAAFVSAGGLPKRALDLAGAKRKSPTTPGAFQACP